MALTRREQPPAIAQPTRWASQWKLPALQNVDWSMACALSDGQVISVKRSERGYKGIVVMYSFPEGNAAYLGRRGNRSLGLAVQSNYMAS